MTFFDLCCGCRMHLAFMVLLGVLDDFAYCCIDFLFGLFSTLSILIDMLDFLCMSNRLFYLRLRGFANIDLYDCFYNSLSGCFVRSLGMVWDLRLFMCYEVYFLFMYDYCYCFCGDAFDRFF